MKIWWGNGIEIFDNTENKKSSKYGSKGCKIPPRMSRFFHRKKLIYIHCRQKKEKCKHYFFPPQNIGDFPWLSRYIFALENGFDPKNPLWAEKGDGWGEVIIWCFVLSMSNFFDIAKLPQRIKTIPSLFSERVRMTVSEKFSHHFHWCEAGTHSRTVSTALRRSTPCSAQSERSVSVLVIERSLESSLNILRRLGWAFDSFGTEKESPIAAQAVWYGSCPSMTTFTFSNGVISNALKIFFHSGKHRVFEYSSFTKDMSVSQYGFSNSAPKTECHDEWIWTVILIIRKK